MRNRVILTLLALIAFDASAVAGRRGQAKSAEVLARRTAASPRGTKEWGGKSMAYLHAGQKEVRRDLGRVKPGSVEAATTFGKNAALVSIRDIVGKHLGLTPGQLASKDRRHDRAVLKQLRRMLRDVRTARATGRPFPGGFPSNLAKSYGELEGQLVREISTIKQRQVDSRRTSH